MLDAGAHGIRNEQGLTVVVSIGSIRLVIRSRPAFEWDTGIYSAFGLRLAEAALVFVKSPSHFRVSFEPHARRILLADTPGPTCPNMRRLVFRNATRPLFPLDIPESI
jgi:microcystin degradation protein MlrC